MHVTQLVWEHVQEGMKRVAWPLHLVGRHTKIGLKISQEPLHAAIRPPPMVTTGLSHRLHLWKDGVAQQTALTYCRQHNIKIIENVSLHRHETQHTALDEVYCWAMTALTPLEVWKPAKQPCLFFGQRVCADGISLVPVKDRVDGVLGKDSAAQAADEFAGHLHHEI